FSEKKQSQNLRQATAVAREEEFFEESQFIAVMPLFLASYSSKHTRLVYQTAVEEFMNFWEKKGVFINKFKELKRLHLEAWQRSMEASGK
ncbi:MAG: hypothetical protein V4591_00255, partial [Bdellovibrionota bacterium]